MKNSDFDSVQRHQISDISQSELRDLQQSFADRMAERQNTSATGSLVGDVARVTISGGQTQTTLQGVASINTNSLTNSDPAQTGIVATARSNFGAPRSGPDMNPDNTIVTLPGGMETTLRAAAAAGFIRKNEHGAWVDAQSSESSDHGQPTDGDQGANEPQQNTSGVPEVEPLDDASEAIMNDFVHRGGNMDVTAAANQWIENGAITPDVVNRIATSMGISPEEASAKFDQLRAAFEQQAYQAVGPQAERVFEWARNQDTKALRDAWRLHSFQGSTAGYKALATRYMETLPEHSPELILNSRDAAERGIRREQDGTVTVAHPRLGRIAWKQAVRMGYIAPQIVRD